MASGGFLGNLIGGVLGLGGGSTYSAPIPQVKASDLVQSSDSKQPNAPVMGDTQNIKKKRGVGSLYVSSGDGGSSGTGLNI